MVSSFLVLLVSKVSLPIPVRALFFSRDSEASWEGGCSVRAVILVRAGKFAEDKAGCIDTLIRYPPVHTGRISIQDVEILAERRSDHFRPAYRQTVSLISQDVD